MRDADAPSPPPDPVAVARFGEALDRLHRRVPGWLTDDRIGVAVSGGPDSLALLLLAHAARPGLIEAATVDHGLRPESAAEAGAVAALCARLGVSHSTLRSVWDDRDGRGLQAAARHYRYREMTDWCARRRLRLLLTAHHADDQAETLLMRLARGAGVRGLRAIRPVARLRSATLPGETGRAGPPPLSLLRPLLGFSKAELGEIVGAAGLAAVDDPANDSLRFDRTRARRLLADAGWLRPTRLAASISHLADADDALAWATGEAERARVTQEDAVDALSYDTWLLDPAGLPDEILRRMVVNILRGVEDRYRCGASGPDAPGPKVMRLIKRLRGGQSATLGNVLVRPGARWRFTVAPPRRP